MPRGILAKPLVLHTRDEGIVVIPSGTQIGVVSNDDWYHDIQDADIQEAIDVLENY